MPISELLPVDISAIQFADRHAAGLIVSDPNGGERFADYIASIMKTDVSQAQYAHEVAGDKYESVRSDSRESVDVSQTQKRVRLDEASVADNRRAGNIVEQQVKQRKSERDERRKKSDDPDLTGSVTSALGQVPRKKSATVSTDNVQPLVDLSSSLAGNHVVLQTQSSQSAVKHKAATLETGTPPNSGVVKQAEKPDPGATQKNKTTIVDLRGDNPRDSDSRGVGRGAPVLQATSRRPVQNLGNDKSGGDRERSEGAEAKIRSAKSQQAGRGSRAATQRADGSQPAQEMRQQTQNASDGVRTPASGTGFDPLNGSDGSPGQSGRQAPIQVLTARATAQTPGGIGQELSQNLRETVNDQIVRSSRMIIRDNAAGEIRLHLKPEHLGDVRFFLELHEGRIAGRIIVENATIRDVFEENIPDLVKAFTTGGFESAMLDVTVSDSGSQREDGGSVAPFKLRELQNAVPEIQVFDDDHVLVDLVV